MSARAATTSTVAGAGTRRLALRITGTVQGVGFRPFVFRLARELELSGWVRNDELGVEAEVEGPARAVEQFATRVAREAPPLAVVESVSADERRPLGEDGFRIDGSRRSGDADAAVAPDAATCPDCLAELLDPGDRRHRYPFINCTNCGPRFTIVRGVPYDRPRTTMAGFAMCARCRAEYEDPADRRFHAQPNACPDCGPRLQLAGRDGTPLPAEDPVAAAAAVLTDGGILAIKGIGGFHLACRADDERIVALLRSRKHREDRPFALMAPDLAAARLLVELTPAEELLLCGRERPIVIARRRPRAGVAESVAPRSADLGVMLPYSPLHHLLLADAGRPLVMTSGNVSDEPIAYADGDALRRLSRIADAFLLHDRPIETRTDDSVVRSLSPEVRSAPLMIRRSRGFAPAPLGLGLPAAARPILACGAEQKNAFCLARGSSAWLSHHVGDLKNYETLRSFAAGVEHFQELFAVEPEIVAHDLHPDYLSTRYALGREGVEHLAVQHHHAHFAAVLAEHGAERDAVGAIYDGTGHGPDDTVWGGELLRGGIGSFERCGCLFPVRMPGGEAAVREPWRMACAWLVAATGVPHPPLPSALRGAVDERRWRVACELVRTGAGSPLTTSAGRLFDAVASLCGLAPRVSYEGQAAIELEGISGTGSADAYPMPAIAAHDQTGDGVTILDARPTVAAIADELEAGADPAAVGGRFHETLARATAATLSAEAERAATDLVVLGGGVFCNRRLLERTTLLARDRGLEVLLPVRLPPNDGGIAYGQAAVAGARMGAG